MVVKVRGTKMYTRKYIEVIGTIYGISGRELDVVHVFVLSHIEKDRLRSKLLKANEDISDTEDKLDVPSISSMVKDPDNIKKLRESIHMSVPVFRNYVSVIKKKGFFLNGGALNKDFIPSDTETTIKIINTNV